MNRNPVDEEQQVTSTETDKTTQEGENPVVQATTETLGAGGDTTTGHTPAGADVDPAREPEVTVTAEVPPDVAETTTAPVEKELTVEIEVDPRLNVKTGFKEGAVPSQLPQGPREKPEAPKGKTRTDDQDEEERERRRLIEYPPDIHAKFRSLVGNELISPTRGPVVSTSQPLCSLHLQLNKELSPAIPFTDHLVKKRGLLEAYTRVVKDIISRWDLGQAVILGNRKFRHAESFTAAL